MSKSLSENVRFYATLGSIHLKSMSIIVAPYLTVEQAAFPLMGLEASPHIPLLSRLQLSRVPIPVESFIRVLG